MKKKRLHSCNVLDASPADQRLWQFSVERDDVNLEAETAVPVTDLLPEKVVAKDWHEL